MVRMSATETLICDTLIEMMGTQPVDKVKVTELVKIAGISRSAFYVYFDSVYAVLQLLEDTFIAGLPDEDDISSGRISESDIYDGFKYVRENLKVYRTLCGPYGDPAFQARLACRSKRVLEKHILSHPSQRTPAEKSMLAECLVASQWAVYKWWAFNEEEVSAVEVYKFIRSRTLKLIDSLGSD